MRRLNTLFVLMLILFSSSSIMLCENTLIGSPVNYIKQDFNVLSYDAGISFDKNDIRSINAYCDIRLNWLTQKSDRVFYFNLLDLNVDSCFYQGQKINAEKHIGDSLESVYYSIKSLGNADTALIRVYYSGIMKSEGGTNNWGGVFFTNKCLYSMGVGFNCDYVSCTRHWLPCYDLPCDKAKFSCYYKVPKGYSAISNGLLVNVDTSDVDYNTFYWKQDRECASYLLAFAIRDYTGLLNFNNNLGKSVQVYGLSKDTNKLKTLFHKMPEAVNYFSSIFGPYAWEKVSYVMTPTGSMEHQSMISYDERLISTYSSKDTANIVGAHELSHQWFGDYATVYDFRDTWLSEGFASYCESLWLGNLYGNSAYQNHQSDFIQSYITYTAKSEGVFPLYNYNRAMPSSNYPSTIYEKGAAVLGMLRYKMGDSSFFKSLRAYLIKSQTADTVNTRLFESVVNSENTNPDFDVAEFFKEWVYGKGYPSYSFIISQKEKQLNIAYKQISNSGFETFSNVPAELLLINNNGDSIYVVFNSMAEIGDTTIPCNNNIVKVNINCGREIRTLMKANISFNNSVDNIDKDEQNISITPNPSDNIIKIKYLGADFNPVFSLYDISGNRLIDSMKANSGDNNTFLFSGDFLSNGLYYVEIKCDKHKYNGRLIIKH